MPQKRKNKTAWTIYLSIKPTDEQISFLTRILWGYRFRRHKCFWNAQRVVIDIDANQPKGDWRLSYCEGYISGCSEDLRVHHAWLLLDHCLVVDVTLRVPKGLAPEGGNRSFLKDRPVGLLPIGWQYKGVEVPVQEITKGRLAGGCRAMLKGMSTVVPHAAEVYARIEDIASELPDAGFSEVVERVRRGYGTTRRDFAGFRRAKSVFSECRKWVKQEANLRAEWKLRRQQQAKTQ